MEIDIKVETEKVQQELNQLMQQLAMIDQQINSWQNQKVSLTNTILKKSGELELLQRLDGGGK